MNQTKQKKLLVTGACGFLGSQCLKWFSKFYDVCGLDIIMTSKLNGVNYIQADITDEKIIGQILTEQEFDIIIHCAALVNPDTCEEKPHLAERVNVLGTKNLVQNFKGEFIYISTDMLFNGEKGEYKETDTPNPINNYGKTKLEGELHVQKYSHSYYIVRTNFYGWNVNKNGASFAEWIYYSLKKNKPINLFYDYIYCPIYIEDLFIIIKQLLNKKQYGIYNAVGKDKVSKYDFGGLLAEKFELNTDSINRVSIEDHKFIAKRPKKMSLNTHKLKSIGIKVPSINEGMNRFFNEKI
jgi:dTDP-4-dehydrorhamnose reductase